MSNPDIVYLSIKASSFTRYSSLLPQLMFASFLALDGFEDIVYCQLRLHHQFIMLLCIRQPLHPLLRYNQRTSGAISGAVHHDLRSLTTARFSSASLTLPLAQSAAHWNLRRTAATPLRGIRCNDTNQRSGMPEFLRCTGKFVLAVFVIEAFTIHNQCFVIHVISF